jgi:DNA-binding GntR family transcriptional regulator
VRESLVQLQLEGLVTVIPQRGAVVFTLTEQEVLEISDFRATVEWSAVEMAMNRNCDAFVEELDRVVEAMGRARANEDLREYMALDNAFHAVSFNHCGNRYLKDCYDRYAGKIAALRVHFVVLPEHTLRSYTEHAAMRECVRAGDRDGFKANLEKHTIGRASEFICEVAKSLDESTVSRKAV